MYDFHMNYHVQSTSERLMELVSKRISAHEISNPHVPEKIKNIFFCLSRGIATKKRIACFALTTDHLYFLTVYPNKDSTDQYGDDYIFCSTNIQDITTVGANYVKSINLPILLSGILLSIIGILLFFFKILSPFLPVTLLMLGVFAAFGAFTFFQLHRYKISIGSLQGGITIMGEYPSLSVKNIVWNQAGTYIFNGKQINDKFYKEIECMNGDISTLQKMGGFIK